MIWKIIPFQGKLVQTALVGAVRNLSLTNASRALQKDHYEILGIKRDASQADIKNAYFELSKMYHPDRIEATDENLAKFREISTAYEVLGNEQSRKLYDRGLLGEGAGIGIDEPIDVKDPIIQFYKERHDKSKLGGEEDMDEWTKQFYKQARKEVFTKNELFQNRKIELREEDEAKERFNFLLGVSVICSFLFISNFGNTLPERVLSSIFG